MLQAVLGLRGQRAHTNYPPRTYSTAEVQEALAQLCAEGLITSRAVREGGGGKGGGGEGLITPRAVREGGGGEGLITPRVVREGGGGKGGGGRGPAMYRAAVEGRGGGMDGWADQRL